MEKIYIKVTRINNRFHSRLLEIGTNKVIDEMACTYKEDIGCICKEMLRWFSKLGGISKWADTSRHRHNRPTQPKGKVWYRKDLIKPCV